ncbi:MAG: hypothetical protein EP326_15285 [Deltaproteobacteria bacterium]|nr:MAG: hypothetical protein EP326_15285 [Deltaproteobacteria bacterium]TNF25377.1 MAG: hypothetical protein EP319_16415 [Deltaproteobacteria bacterium]
MIKILITFLAITGAATLLMNFTDVQFGLEDYWNNHGVWFLIFITLFPRLTLLFSSVPFGGFFWWLGFFFAPRILVAILATLSYWEQNPVLVVISWLMAIGGESGEKVVVRNRYDVVKRGGSVFEAEFRRL